MCELVGWRGAASVLCNTVEAVGADWGRTLGLGGRLERKERRGRWMSAKLFDGWVLLCAVLGV